MISIKEKMISDLAKHIALLGTLSTSSTKSFCHTWQLKGVCVYVCVCVGRGGEGEVLRWGWVGSSE